MSAKEAKAEFQLAEGAVWSIPAAQADLRSFGISRDNVRRILYRPFDWRYIYYTHKSGGFLGRPRYEVMQHLVNRENIGLIFNRQIVGDAITQFGVSRDLICHGTFYLGNKGQDYLAPLYLRGHDLLSGELAKGMTNLRDEYLSAMSRALGDKSPNITSEDVFHFIYGVLQSPAYRNRYGDFLKMDFPRLPITRHAELFRELARLGAEIVRLHLLESPLLETRLTTFTGPATSRVERISFARNTVCIDKNQSIGFKDVPEEVWNFNFGGYKVCEKWLKDRKGRTLSKEDISHYGKIVTALGETIRLMAEIDRVIDAHGGWPGAFAVDKS